ncbi:transposase [Promethearchaeum syntrophicum]|uniref:Transposase n=1 Tax=Promethearchaeum syntrophicum TaxID=2594042 RepID=A0A5B9D9D6_9ARCH|nr:transposase [Candidatus Prometheoarchaeum syntrophicum]QEE15693.1 Transposase IS200 like protein [Candidatus Prometheoarchaeum syntrophicum]
MKLIEFLRYECIFCTKGDKSLFTTKELKDKMEDIITNYFNLEKNDDDVKLISVYLEKKHIEIIFEAKSQTDLSVYGEKKTKKDLMKLTKFISNLKSVSSRRFLQHLSPIKSGTSGIWTKNYLLATQEHQLEQKIKSFLQAQEYKSIL